MQVLANTAVTEEVVRAVAHNNMLAASGKMEGGAANKKGVANAAKRLEGMLDRDKVRGREGQGESGGKG